MDYLDIGDTINYSKYNALVYLLRKFKRLTSDLRISTVINSDYGIYTFSNGLTSIGGNYIIEDDVTITSNNCLKNCFYTFIFTAIDVNLTGEVNKREVSVTGGTGENGVLDVTLASDVLESDEVLLPDFKVSIVFDPHEYYTPVEGINIELTCDKNKVDVGETCTVTAVATNVEGEPYEDISLDFRVNGVSYAKTTDENGRAEYTYTGIGGVGKVTVTVLGQTISFYDGVGLLIAEYTGNSITLGANVANIFSLTTDMIIDWGDDTTTFISKDNIPKKLTHTYNDDLETHVIVFNGTVTAIGTSCFNGATGLTSITIPTSVTSLGSSCFYYSGLTSVNIPINITTLPRLCFMNCANLTSITIPNGLTAIGANCFTGSGLTTITLPSSVYSIGAQSFSDCVDLTSVTILRSGLTFFDDDKAFIGCSNIVDYQLYWENPNILNYNTTKLPYNANTVFTVPCGQKSNYIAKGYPTAKVQERPNSLTITADKLIIQSSETSTITCKLACGTTGVSGKTLSYQLKHGDTTITSGTGTTDSNGEITITYTGTAVGQVDVIVTYGSLLQETFVVYDSLFYDKGTLAQHKTDYSTDSSISVSYSDDDTTLSRSLTAYSVNSISTINGNYQWRDSSKNYCIEVDIVNFNDNSDGGSVSVAFGGTSQGLYYLTPNQSHSGSGHLKIVTNEDSYDCYWNGVKKATKTMSNAYGFGFALYRNPTITFKNLVIYTI